MFYFKSQVAMHAPLLLILVVATSFTAADQPWWRTATIYELYPRSFRDTDGNGIGDLKGVLEKAQYLKDIGVDAVWLTPIYRSPMLDAGYDIYDFKDIDPLFGSMADFEQLVDTLHKLDLKVILDFVPNHTSDLHPWFQASRDPSHPLHDDYKDFYVWVDPIRWENDTPIAPNNWKSVFNGPAWKFNDARQQFYYHLFATQQPDLNYYNPNVVGNISDIIDYWLGKGVDGLRMDSVDHLCENMSLPSEPPLPGMKGEAFNQLDHIYIANQPRTFELLRQFAGVVLEKIKQDGRQRLMIQEVYANLNNTMKYFGTGDLSMQIPFNFNMFGFKLSSTSFDFKRAADEWINAMPADGTSTWVVGNHDVTPRTTDRLGQDFVDAINMLLATLAGTHVTYYGEELGMASGAIRWDQVRDPNALNAGPSRYTVWDRDVVRTPMQWDDSKSAGFSSTLNTWLPVNAEYWRNNVKKQLSDSKSHLSIYKAMAKERKSDTMKYGSMQILTPSNYTLAVVRSLNMSRYALIINLDSVEITITPGTLLGNDLDWNLAVASAGVEMETGIKVKSGTVLTLRPKQAVLLRSDSSAPSSSPPYTPLASALLLCTLFPSLLQIITNI